MTPPHTHHMLINLTPASYTGVALAAADLPQQSAPYRPTFSPPAITEVTVLHSSGLEDTHTEQQIWAHAPDSIVHEVKLKMAKALTDPIPLHAGCWSIQALSKGNFVYSFNGHIPFDIISSYKHILLEPFHGSGQLCPSLGWTRLLDHGVPLINDVGNAFNAEELQQEVCTLLGLGEVFFAMAPRWLKPVGTINSTYSSITFAISDLNGATTNALMTGCAALFGKEVLIEKWIDKPPLVQCSKCHVLGHVKSSKACPLDRDLVKCHICGCAHRSEEHNQRCPQKHTITSICDCTTYKCLNCHHLGHHCRKGKCPACTLFHPCNTRQLPHNGNKGKGQDLAEGPGLPTPATHTEEVMPWEDDPFFIPPLPPNPTGP